MLYFIPTPIWNLDDITIRAIKSLSQLNFLICEDTRSTKKLLNLLKIDYSDKKFYSLTSFTTDHKIDFFCDLIQKNDIWLLSDAGSPWLSDPGKSIIEICHSHNILFTILPWANALMPSVISSWFDTSRFTFLGFLPKKKWRQTIFNQILLSENPIFFYESVHRIEKTIYELKEIWFLGKVSISREISKIHEQFITDDIDVVLDSLKSWKIIKKWEFVIGLYKTKNKKIL